MQRDESRGKKLADYWPLLSLVLVAAAAGYALTFQADAGMQAWMHYFMGFFLCSLAAFKIFDLRTFADGFQMYDIIGKGFRAYACAYPFVELALGLGYLSFFAAPLVYAVTVIVMAVNAVSVLAALARGLDIACPCMGTALSVPLSTVTLTEDAGMGGMAAAMLAMTMV